MPLLRRFLVTSSLLLSSTIFPAVTAQPRPPTANFQSAISQSTSPSTLTVSHSSQQLIKPPQLIQFPAIVKIFKAYPNTAIALVIEPDSLPNLVTNADKQACKDSATGYREGVAYALKQLNLPNIAMYIDAGHGGWLGWNDNLKPGAKELATVYKNAGSPKQVRGFATNVAGWNSWDLSPGEFSKATDAQWNKCQNEKLYVEAFSPELKSAGMPSQAIVDTGRNAVTGLRKEWGNWCNVNGAGFGVRPTGSTGSSLADAFVWVKPGGESDGTSDTGANRYDSFCGKEDAFKPSPEAGTWNQAYFEMLVKNAKPAF
jgi:cellulose 1,4-beta-cellobiosidase